MFVLMCMDVYMYDCGLVLDYECRTLGVLKFGYVEVDERTR